MIRICAAIGLMMTTTQTAAQAHCPTSADLETGIHLIEDSGDPRLFVQRADGLYNGWGDTADRGPHPHPLLPGIRVSAVGDLTIEYESDPAKLELLEAKAEWVSDVTYLRNGISVASGTATVSYSGPWRLGPQMLGSCSYELSVYRVTLGMNGDFVAQMNGSEFLAGELYFSPELGLVVAGTRLNRMGVPSGDWRFKDIAKVPG